MRPDLTGLTGEYRQRLRRWDTVRAWAGAIITLGLLVSSVLLHAGVLVVVSAALFVQALVQVWARVYRPPMTCLDAEGVLVRTAPGRPWWVPLRRRVRWEDVDGITAAPQAAAGAWDAVSCARLASGRQVPLPGVPREVAERLSTAVAG